MESLVERMYMTEQGDSSSAEEVDSPKSVVSAAARKRGGGRLRRWRKGGADQKNDAEHGSRSSRYLHNQVLRIKEEELQIGEDLMLNYYYYYHISNNNNSSNNVDYSSDNNYVASYSTLDYRAVNLPASPLSGKKKDRGT